MAVPDLLVPYLQWLAADAVQDGQEPALERVLEHFSQFVLLSREVGENQSSRGLEQITANEIRSCFLFLASKEKTGASIDTTQTLMVHCWTDSTRAVTLVS